MTRTAKRIAVASQNFRTVTPHAGKTRRWLVFEARDGADLVEVDRLDLPRDMALHEWGDREGRHPLFEMDALVVASCGAGFVRRMSRQGVRVGVAENPDPIAATTAFLASGAMEMPFEAFIAAAMAQAEAGHHH